MSEDSKRLDRIESKLDKLADLVATIARLDEKVAGVNNRINRHEFRLDDQERKTEELTEIVTNNASQLKNTERFSWVLISALASYSVYLFKI